MANFRDLLARVKAEIEETSAEDVKRRLERGDHPILLDVREQEEVEGGLLPGARHLGRAHFESRIEDVVPDKESDVVVYCASGVRSAFAAKTLLELGYERVSSLVGGFNRWRDLGYEVSIPRTLDPAQRDRYSRHLVLPEVGEEGQRAFLDAKVLCIGAGGLGSPALLYLAAAGVGRIGIVDSDRVEASNLQRQVVHNTESIGALKAESAKEALTKLNPDVQVTTHPVRLDAGNARAIMSGYDVIVDGSDNFDTRYLVNDVAVELGKPVVHGSIFRFDGVASTCLPGEGPCYRCLYREAPPPELAPT
jgi:molybdopterin/thiamine biosynthesis adenylyltransferase/rhodanese-related sulfurtransferase